jgi:hypothetical protein
MTEQHKHFRYLIPPGNNFAFVRKFRYWIIASFFLMAAAIGALFLNKSTRGEYMNWTIDFKGGSEIIFAFKDPNTGAYVKADPGKVRKSLEEAGEHVEISDIAYTETTPKGDVTVNGLMVRTGRFSALKDDQKKASTDDFIAKFKDREVGKATWSGDRLFVRSKQPITNEEAAKFFQTHQLELKPWSQKETDQYAHADEGTGEYNQVFSMWGTRSSVRADAREDARQRPRGRGAELRRRREGRREATR